MSPEELDTLERLAKTLITPSDGGTPRTAIVGPWWFNEGAPAGCVNLWADQIPIACVQHPESARYLAAISPDVVLSLVEEVRKLRAQLRAQHTVCRGDLCVGPTTCPAGEDGYRCTRGEGHPMPHIACMGGPLQDGHNLVTWEG